jgi:hypothetical protein
MANPSKPRCGYEGCVAVVKARGLCRRHYHEALAAGRTCKIEGCENPLWSRGFCSVHYYRWHKHGDPGEVELRRKPTRPCKVEGCKNTAKTSADLCPTHSRRKRLYGDEHGMFRTHQPCVECGDPAVAAQRSSDYCRAHYVDFVKSLIVERKIVAQPDSAGYVYHSVFKTRLAEHRVVMEHILGRPLEKWETPHHKNGRRHDNRPSNLELWVVAQPKGQRASDLAEWVVAHYPDLVRDALMRLDI